MSFALMTLAFTIHRPRVLRVDLTRLAASGGRDGAALTAWSDADARIDRIGAASGSALAAALFWRAVVTDPARTPLILSVGTAVRAGLPTAARTSVLARSPLTGSLSEGQIGGPFGRSFASVADALVLTGSSGLQGAILVVREGGKVELWVDHDLVHAPVRSVRERLTQRHGPCAALAIGRAGEALLPFASIASLEDPPSFVGRGGLGAVFAGLGLKAIVVLAPEVTADPARAEIDRELQRALSRSPRLKARSIGGTLELGNARAARGESEASLTSSLISADSRAALPSVDGFETLVAANVDKKGCEGCPTPCGLVFERSHAHGATRHLARFGALNALADRVGLDVSDARHLLERCDEWVMDAKEAGAVLALSRSVSHAGAPFTLERALAELDDVVLRRGLGAVLSAGSKIAARSLATAAEARRPDRTRETETNLAMRLGQAVSTRGSDPMRTFSFLAVDAASRERLVAAMDGLPLPERAEVPDDPAGKGRIVWWHENLVSALDATGFCAFSAAGLVSDGIASVDELARWIGSDDLRSSARPGRALLALGASITLLQRDIAARLGALRDEERDAVLDHPSLRPEYEALRGLDARGLPTEEALALLGEERILAAAFRLDGHASVARTDPAPAEARAGRITLCARGPLGSALSGEHTLACAVPIRLRACVEEAARRLPLAERWLVQGGHMVPQAWRCGRRLEPDDWLLDGDRVDLVVAVGGG